VTSTRLFFSRSRKREEVEGGGGGGTNDFLAQFFGTDADRAVRARNRCGVKVCRLGREPSGAWRSTPIRPLIWPHPTRFLIFTVQRKSEGCYVIYRCVARIASPSTKQDESRPGDSATIRTRTYSALGHNNRSSIKAERKKVCLYKQLSHTPASKRNGTFRPSEPRGGM